MLAIRPIVRWSDDKPRGEEVGHVVLLKTENLSTPKPKGRAPSVYGKFCTFCGKPLLKPEAA